jgi:hypothetical protein
MADEAAKNEKEKKKKESELEKKTKEEHDKLSEEQKKKAAEKQKEEVKKEEPKKTTLFDKIFDFGYHAAMAVGTTALGVATAGIAAPIIGGAFAGTGLLGSFFSKKEKPSLYERVLSAFRTYSVVNTILSPMVALGDITYPLINNATLLGKAARVLYAVGPYNIAFTTAFKTGDHLVKNKFDFTGIGKSIKDNFGPMYKRFAIGFSPGFALSANGIASIAGYPTFFWNALPLGFYSGVNPPGLKKTEEKKNQPQPAYPQIPQGYQPAPG